jgi:hypothetical protein
MTETEPTEPTEGGLIARVKHRLAGLAGGYDGPHGYAGERTPPGLRLEAEHADGRRTTVTVERDGLQWIAEAVDTSRDCETPFAREEIATVYDESLYGFESAADRAWAWMRENPQGVTA